MEQQLEKSIYPNNPIFPEIRTGEFVTLLSIVWDKQTSYLSGGKSNPKKIKGKLKDKTIGTRNTNEYAETWNPKVVLFTKR